MSGVGSSVAIDCFVAGLIGGFEVSYRRGFQVNQSKLLSRMVNLTTLAPDIVAAILDEALPPDLTLMDIAVDPLALWEKQWNRINGNSTQTG